MWKKHWKKSAQSLSLEDCYNAHFRQAALGSKVHQALSLADSQGVDPGRAYILQIVDEIISEMPLEERVSLANMNEKDVDVLQAAYDLYIRRNIDPEDEDYKIINHLELKTIKIKICQILFFGKEIRPVSARDRFPLFPAQQFRWNGGLWHDIC
jgi:hypothetical protein